MTNQAAYTGWLEESLSLPSMLLHNQDQAQCFRDDILFIESLQAQVVSNVQKYVDKPRAGSVGKEHEIATQCQQYFLQMSHDLLFGTAMEEICSDMPEKEHVEHFCEAVKRLLQDTFNQVLHASGFDAQSMMRQMEAERWIWSAFKNLTEERMKYYA